MPKPVALPHAPPASPFASRAALLATFTIVTLGCFVKFAGLVPIVELVTLTLWVVGLTGWGAAILHVLDPTSRSNDATPSDLARSQPSPALRLATAFAIGLGTVGLAAHALGLAGWLNRASAAALLAAGTVLAVRRVAKAWPAIESHARAPAGSAWGTILLAPVLALSLTGAMILPGILFGADEPAGYDVVGYHLQVPREWFELGRIEPLWHNTFSLHPMLTETHALLAMHLRGGPYAGMYLAQMMHTAIAVMLVVATYGFARPLGRGRATVAALLAGTTPWVPMLGAVAFNEPALMLYTVLALGIGMLLLQTRGEQARRLNRWVVVGLLLGFACATKYTGFVTTLILVPVALVIHHLAASVATRSRDSTSHDDAVPTTASAPASRDTSSRDPARLDHAASTTRDEPARTTGSSSRRAVDDSADDRLSAASSFARSFAGVALATLVGVVVASPWLIRNVAWAGNPVFPLATGTLGRGPWDEGQTARHAAAHAPRADQQSIAERLVAFGAQVALDEHYGATRVAGPDGQPRTVLPSLLLVVGVASIAIGLARRESHAPVIHLVGLTAFWLLGTHLQGRFFTQAIPILAMLAVVPRPKFWPAVALLAVVANVVTLIDVARRSSAFLPALAVDDPRLLLEQTLPPDVFRAIYGTDRPIVLVGDAKAFWYSIPMSRLRYRYVFDVPSTGEDLVRAWVKDVPAGALVVVDPNELRRFETTYRRLPKLDDATASMPGPFVITRP